MMGARYLDQSCLGGATSAPGQRRQQRSCAGQPRISTPLAANTAPMRGRDQPPAPRAPAGLGGVQGCTSASWRCRSPGAPWRGRLGVVHVGVAVAVQVLDDGHAWPQRLMRSIRPLPPRGMITSTYSGMADELPTAARSVVGRAARRRTAGRSSNASPPAANARLDSIASRAPAQDAGIAALDRQARRLDGDVRATLENHPEHADGHAHLSNPDAAGCCACR